MTRRRDPMTEVLAEALHATFLLDNEHAPNMKGYAHCDCREKAALQVAAWAAEVDRVCAREMGR